MCLFTNHSSSNACIVVLSKLTLVFLCAPFLSLLPHRWWFTIHALWLHCKTWENAELAVALLTLYIAWNIAWKFWSTLQRSWKWCVVINQDQTTHPLFWLITEACTLTMKHSVVTGLIAAMLFCPVFITLCNWLKINGHKLKCNR